MIISLIGTTIVPYNLFLAAGITKGQTISEMQWGITSAVVIGGIISIAILLVGTSISGEFSFAQLSKAMESNTGKFGSFVFGLGLFAAGLSSSITSPLATAITGQSLFHHENANWATKKKNFYINLGGYTNCRLVIWFIKP